MSRLRQIWARTAVRLTPLMAQVFGLVARLTGQRHSRGQDRSGSAPSGDWIVCLGAGHHQVPVIEAAKDLGYRVIAVDRNPQAPGFARADLTVICDLTQARRIYQKVSEGACDARVRGVVTRSFGRIALTGALVAARLGVTHNPWSVLRQFANKRTLKRLLPDSVPMPQAHTWARVRDRWALTEAPLPLIARPARGHAKLGVELLRTRAAVDRFLRKHSPDAGHFLVESFVEGLEVAALGMVTDGRYNSLIVSDRITSDTPPLYAEVMHRFPSLAPDQVVSQIESIMQTIVDHTGYRSGPLVGEFIIAEDGTPHLVEVVPEAGGEYLADVAVPQGTGVDFIRCLVAGALGRSLFDAAATTKRAVIIRYILPEDGVLQSFSFPPRLLQHPALVMHKQLVEPGHLCSTHRGNMDRLAVFALAGKLEDQARLEQESSQLAEEFTIEYEPGETRLGKTLRPRKGKARLP